MPVQYKFGYDKSKLIFMFLLIAFPLFIAKANTTMIMEVLSNITIPVMLILTVAAMALSVIFIDNCRDRDLRNSFLHRQVHKKEVTPC
mgnify:CR=1 FL=1